MIKNMRYEELFKSYLLHSNAFPFFSKFPCGDLFTRRKYLKATLSPGAKIEDRLLFRTNFYRNNLRRSSESQAHLRRVDEQMRSGAYRGELNSSTKEIRLAVRGILYLRTSLDRVTQKRETEQERSSRTNFPRRQFSAKRLLSRVRNLFINLSPRHARKSVYSRLALCSHCTISPFIMRKVHSIQRTNM